MTPHTDDLLTIDRTPIEGSASERFRSVRRLASSDAILEVIDADGLVRYRRADDTRGLRSIAGTLPVAEMLTALDVGIGEAVKDEIRELIGEPVSEITAQHITRYLIPAVDALRSEDDVFRTLQDASGSSVGKKGGQKVLLLHGTFSSPEGSFADLSDVMGAKSARAYSHRTLTKSPVRNAIELCAALLKDDWSTGAEVTLVSHSRGGLVGELLARIELPRKERERAYTALASSDSATREELRQLDVALDKLSAKRNLKLVRFVRVAAPAAGTSLATEELPRKLEALLNALGVATKLLPLDPWHKTLLRVTYSFVKAVVLGIVRYGISADYAPGLAAMHSRSAIVRVLRATPPLSLQTTAVGSRLRGRWALSFEALLAKGAARAGRVLFKEDHDMVVNCPSMLAGIPRQAGCLEDRVRESETTWHVSYFGASDARPIIVDAIEGKTTDGAPSVDDSTRTRSARSNDESSAGDSEPTLPKLYLFRDEALRSRRDGWPSTSLMLRNEDAGEAASATEAQEHPYASLARHFELVEDLEDASLIVAHGTGITRFLERARNRVPTTPTVFLGRLDEPWLEQRRARIERALEPFASSAADATKLAAELVPPPIDSEVRPKAWIVGVDAPPNKDRWRGDETSGWLGSSDRVAEALAWFMRAGASATEAPPGVEKADARAAREVPLPDEPDHLADEPELIAASLGPSSLASLGEAVPPLLSIGVLYGAPHSAKAELILLPHYEGDGPSDDAHALVARGKTDVLRPRAAMGMLPKRGASKVLSSDDHNALLIGLPPVFDAVTTDLRRATELGVLEASAMGWDVERVAIPVMGGDPSDRFSIVEALEAVVDGILDARARLRSLGRASPTRLELVARHEDVAIDAGHACQAATAGRELKGVVYHPLRRGNGYLGRAPSTALQHETWSRFRVTTRPDDAREGELELKFEIDDGRSVRRTERGARPSAPSLGIEAASRQIAGELLPGAVRNAEIMHRHLVFELDEASAIYPWELVWLPRCEPLALRFGLIRQLIDVPRVRGIEEVIGFEATVIGDPSGTGAHALPAAEVEAKEIHALLTQNGYTSTLHRRAPGESNHLALEGRHSILHIAAHGFADGGGGVLLGGGKILTPALVLAQQETPSLVFLNCCEAGALGALGTSALHQLAGAYMAQGTRAFIGAAWPVGDAAALLFARTFYEQLIRGASLGRAVTVARARTQERFGDDSTWAAYQVYGDPAFVLRVPRPEGAPVFVLPQEAEDTLVSLIGDMQFNFDEETARRIRARVDQVKHALDRIGALDGDAYRRRGWSMVGRVQERLGMAYLLLGCEDKAIELWKRAVNAKTARIECLEALFDLEARRAYRSKDAAGVTEARDRMLAVARVRETSNVLRLLAQSHARAHALGKGGERKAAAAYSIAFNTATGSAAKSVAAEWALLFGSSSVPAVALQTLTTPVADHTVADHTVADHARAGSARAALPDALACVALAKPTAIASTLRGLEGALGDRISQLGRSSTIDLLDLGADLRKHEGLRKLADALRGSARPCASYPRVGDDEVLFRCASCDVVEPS